MRARLALACLALMMAGCMEEAPTPGGFTQARLDNPYCATPTYRNDHIPFRGLATYTHEGPVIFMRGDAMHDPALYRFILAHECGHHARHDVRTPPPNAFSGAERELEADCWAAETLARRGDDEAIMAALNDAGAYNYDYRDNYREQARHAAIRQCAGTPGGGK